MTVTNKQKDVPVMYCLPKMHETSIGYRFVVSQDNATLNHSLNLFIIFSKWYTPIWKVFITKVGFNFKQFWIVQNLFPTIAKLLSISVHFILLFHINLSNEKHESSWIFRIISILDIWTSWKKKNSHSKVWNILFPF